MYETTFLFFLFLLLSWKISQPDCGFKFKWYTPHKINLFNQSVDSLLQFITHLTFYYKFNQSVDYLPQSITHLTFGNYFNQSVDYFPQSITHLGFGDEFNQSVDYI